jgi:hypothetical protein
MRYEISSNNKSIRNNNNNRLSVTMTEVVTDWSTFIFQGGWMGQGKGVVASFLVGAGKLGSWSFLQVAACK